ncbi:glycoside hydrolase family 125 protein [Arachnia propionica]|uniref:Glycoside hydrolase family 125 protein n=1 Tax=Arachnia propionica TaxID=1750 RepID=A0A3P1TB77_9ACTN|nr:glycoside hydrolase family 125 protein [Arachnia propionica]MDO5082119.1 glycoside hydrolase family 125 protein [Arachnia propionica]RRD06664.1 glycoside hydrolase family 125 protein [Arachnia propionica]
MTSWGETVGVPTRNPLRLDDAVLDRVQTLVGAAVGEEAARMCVRFLVNTATTTVDLSEEAFVITGDIPAMWLRDSCLQLAPFLRLGDPELLEVAASLLRRHWRMIRLDPYANAFNATANGNRWDDDEPLQHPHVWERKWELDSLTHPLDLALRLERLGCTSWRSPDFLPALRVILEIVGIEQDHEVRSRYRFHRPGASPSDTLGRDGRGPLTRPTGLVWQGFRPSDDACELGFNIPANLYLASTLRGFADLPEVGGPAALLSQEILRAVKGSGIVDGVLAYEVDGAKGHVMLDDANVPSLLSLPWLGVLAADDPLYLATREVVLSAANPHFHTDAEGRGGVGSPHTPGPLVWPIGIAMAGLTALSPEERRDQLELLQDTTGGTGWMHEAYHVADPRQFTRPWFSWANSMFVDLALEIAGLPRPGTGLSPLELT